MVGRKKAVAKGRSDVNNNVNKLTQDIHWRKEQFRKQWKV
jgi:hypothetical protein